MKQNMVEMEIDDDGYRYVVRFASHSNAASLGATASKRM